MAFSCGCGRNFDEETSLLQHERDAHSKDTNERLRKIAEGKKLAEKKKEAGRAKPRSRVPYAIGAMALVAVVVLFFSLQAPPTGAAAQDIPVGSVRFLELGSPGAPNVIEEFGDYECPFCARFHTQTFSQLKKDFIDTGKARYIFKDFPLSHAHFNAQKAAEAAHCAADQGKYLEYHDKLYSNSYTGDRWASKPAAAVFKKYAADLGLDTAQFNKCLDSGVKAGIVRAGLAEGQNKGVSGTPSFFVNGRLISGAQPYHVFAQLLAR